MSRQLFVPSPSPRWIPRVVRPHIPRLILVATSAAMLFALAGGSSYLLSNMSPRPAKPAAQKQKPIASLPMQPQTAAAMTPVASSESAPAPTQPATTASSENSAIAGPATTQATPAAANSPSQPQHATSPSIGLHVNLLGLNLSL